MPVGQLTVEIGASLAKFTEDMGKASALADRNAKQIERSMNAAFDHIKGAAVGVLAPLTAALSVHAFAGLISDALDAEENLGNIGARAGITGEELSKLSRAARLSHTDLSDIADMSAKLSKAFLNFGNDTAKSTVVLKALGFTAAEIPALLASPAEGLQKYAKAIQGISGGTQAGANLLVLGRGGGAAAAAMKELASQTELVATRTNEQIAAAKEFNDRMSDMHARTTILKQDFANALLPVMSDVLDAFVKSTTGANSLQEGLKKLVDDGSIREWGRDAALVLGTIGESLVFLGRLVRTLSSSFAVVGADIKVGVATQGVSGAVETGDPQLIEDANRNLEKALAERNKTLADANQKYEDLWTSNGAFITDKLKQQFAVSDLLKQAQSGAFDDPNDRRNAAALAQKAKADADAAGKAAAAKAKAIQDALVKNAKLTNADDPSKKLLEAQLKAIDASVEEESRTLAGRNETLTAFYDLGYISLQDYYQKRKNLINEGLAFDEQAYDESVADLKKYLARSDITRVNRADATGKLDEVEKKRRLAEIGASSQLTKVWFDQQKAAEAYRHELDNITAELLTLQGKTAESAAISFANSHEDLRTKLKGTIDTGTPEEAVKARLALDQLKQIEDITGSQNKLSEAVGKTTLTYDELSNAIGHLYVQQNHGSLSEIDYLNKVSAANKALIPILQEQLAAEQAIADTLGGEAGRKAQIQVDQLRIRLEDLAASTDLLGEKFHSIFADTFSTALTDAVTGTKSLKAAFTDMAKSIEHDIAQMASKDIAQKLFGKEGTLGSIPDFFSKIFGGGGSGSSLTSSVASDAPSVDVMGMLAGGSRSSESNAPSFLSKLFGSSTNDASSAALRASTTASSIALDAFTVALNAATAAAASSSASGGLSGLGGLGGFASVGASTPSVDIIGMLAGGAAASGTKFARGGLTLVGEKGPEVVNMPRGAQVIPNDSLTSALSTKQATVHNHYYNITVPPDTSRSTASQLALESARALQRGAARNG